MKIDWVALSVVSVVSVVATVIFVALLAGGIRLLAGTAAVAGSSGGARAVSPQLAAGGRPARVFGVILIGLAGLLVALGIYLILPFSG